MKSFLVIISMWGFNGYAGVYIGNQYVMQELFTLQQCERIIDLNGWEAFEENENYKIQLDCVHKDTGEK